MRYHWVKDQVGLGNFSVSWAPGKLNLADFFTKALPPSVHMRLVQRLTGHLPFCGTRALNRYYKEVHLQASAHCALPSRMHRWWSTYYHNEGY
jgi:hypothetical protein